MHTAWRVAGTVLCGGLHCPSLSGGGKELLPRGRGGRGRWVFVDVVLARKLLLRRLGDAGNCWTSGSPHCTLWPQFVGVCICVNMRLSLCTCVSACLLCGFLYLFVILDTGWLGLLGWLVGSWEGLSCWRFQIEPVSGRAQLLETVTFLLEI